MAPHASIDLAVAAARPYRHDTGMTDIDLHGHRGLELAAIQRAAVVGETALQARLPGRHDDSSNAPIMEVLRGSPSPSARVMRRWGPGRRRGS